MCECQDRRLELLHAASGEDGGSAGSTARDQLRLEAVQDALANLGHMQWLGQGAIADEVRDGR